MKENYQMRINVYSQELTKEIAIVKTVARDNGTVHYGIRLFLSSPDILHHTKDDDDRSAITFWIPNAECFTGKDLADVFDKMALMVRSIPDTKPKTAGWPVRGTGI